MACNLIVAAFCSVSNAFVTLGQSVTLSGYFTDDEQGVGCVQSIGFSVDPPGGSSTFAAIDGSTQPAEAGQTKHAIYTPTALGTYRFRSFAQYSSTEGGMVEDTEFSNIVSINVVREITEATLPMPSAPAGAEEPSADATAPELDAGAGGP